MATGQSSHSLVRCNGAGSVPVGFDEAPDSEADVAACHLRKPGTPDKPASDRPCGWDRRVALVATRVPTGTAYRCNCAGSDPSGHGLALSEETKLPTVCRPWKARTEDEIPIDTDRLLGLLLR